MHNHDNLDLDLDLDFEASFAQIDEEFKNQSAPALAALLSGATAPTQNASRAALSPAPSPPEGGIHTTIRIPAEVVESYRQRASIEGTRYQTLMNRILREASVKWGT